MEAIRLLILACSMGGINTPNELAIQRNCQRDLIQCYKSNATKETDQDALTRCLLKKGE